MEVLRRKNFHGKWVEWMESAVVGGRLAINLNGEKGEFFRGYKGVDRETRCHLFYLTWWVMCYLSF